MAAAELLAIASAWLWFRSQRPASAPLSGRLGPLLGFLVLAVDLAAQLQFEPEFSSRPDYYGRLKGPSLVWAKPAGEAQLLEELPALFDRADAEIEDQERAESKPQAPVES